METFAASDHRLRPEDPPHAAHRADPRHPTGGRRQPGRLPSPGRRAGAAALTASLGHLGRPVHAWKALRNLGGPGCRGRWCCSAPTRGAAAMAVVVPRWRRWPRRWASPGCSPAPGCTRCRGGLRGTPPLTVAQFGLTAAMRPPSSPAIPGMGGSGGRRPAGGVGGQPGPAGTGAAAGVDGHGPAHAGVVRALVRPAGAPGAGRDRPGPGRCPPGRRLRPLALSEAANRYLFYVTVVPLNVPGTFFRGSSAVPEAGHSAPPPRADAATDGRLACRGHAAGGWASITGRPLPVRRRPDGRADQRVAAPRRWVRTTCGYCSVGCGMLPGSAATRWWRSAATPTTPSTGGACAPRASPSTTRSPPPGGSPNRGCLGPTA